VSSEILDRVEQASSDSAMDLKNLGKSSVEASQGCEAMPETQPVSPDADTSATPKAYERADDWRLQNDATAESIQQSHQ
jgi:hypothetical protein